MTSSPPRKSPHPYPNPWGLTPAEEKTLSLYCAKGSVKAAAGALSIQRQTANTHLLSVRRKMKTPSYVLAALTWDRWTREGKEGTPK